MVGVNNLPGPSHSFPRLTTIRTPRVEFGRLDRNYLSKAEETGHVEIKPLHMVTSIEESDRGGYRVLANVTKQVPHILLVGRSLALSAVTTGKSKVIETCLSLMVRSFQVRPHALIPH